MNQPSERHIAVLTDIIDRHPDPNFRSMLIDQLWTAIASDSPIIAKAVWEVLSDPDISAEIRKPNPSPTWSKLENIVHRYTEGKLMGEDEQTALPPVRWQADIGILTPLPEESREVGNWLEESGNFEKWPDRSGRYHYCAKVQMNGQFLRIANVVPLMPGQLSMVRALESMAEYHAPKLTVLMGIGGDMQDKQLGDVIVATTITYYDPNASTSTGTEREMQSFPIDTKIKGILNDFFRANGDKVEIRSKNGKAYYLTMGPIGSGSSVVKDSKSEVVDSLRIFNRKTSLVETEAAAVASAFDEDHEPGKYMIVIRALSDHLDDKNDKYHKLACENAVLAFQRLIPYVWRELRNNEES